MNNFFYKSNFKIIIFLIIMFVYYCSVVYSAFSSTIVMTGTAYARIATDVRITNFKISEKYSSTNYVSNYEKFSKNSISPSITFDGTGTVYYDIEITNYNENKVGLFSISGLPEGLSCSFYDISSDGVLLDGIGTATFTVSFSGTGNFKFDFIIDIRSIYSITYEGFENNNYPISVFENEKKVINFENEDISKILMLVNDIEYSDYVFENNVLTFGPVDGNVIITNKKSLNVISGDLDTVGSEVCIDNECFYIISSNDSTVAMLAKYNLYVGGEYNGSAWKAYGTKATGIQDSTMLGYKSSGAPYSGTTVFSSTAYWSSTVSTYPTYIYDSNSSIYNYVENYKLYLEQFDVVINEARLISYEELVSLGCREGSLTCASAPEWVYSFSYWTGSLGNTSHIWFVNKDKSFNKNIRYGNNLYFGVRPVIVISKL